MEEPARPERPHYLPCSSAESVTLTLTLTPFAALIKVQTEKVDCEYCNAREKPYCMKCARYGNFSLPV
jgi:hypothetical protein